MGQPSFETCPIGTAGGKPLREHCCGPPAGASDLLRPFPGLRVGVDDKGPRAWRSGHPERQQDEVEHRAARDRRECYPAASDVVETARKFLFASKFSSAAFAKFCVLGGPSFANTSKVLPLIPQRRLAIRLEPLDHKSSPLLFETRKKLQIGEFWGPAVEWW